MSIHPLLKFEISQLSIAERIQLAEDLWDSILEQQDELPLSDPQKQELDCRGENYQQNPASGSTWEDAQSNVGARGAKSADSFPVQKR
ncbi:MAG: addiction module protein [Oscillatoriophycideae cyanobacterium NC_groundwater_1537_Pr4_S-0.65um_50_18]|nr:addiction module protein [Oscillatoriophycideae cyanobacterium NC_groundwater_1537_Pr4_S-0.65um_50_18]